MTQLRLFFSFQDDGSTCKPDQLDKYVNLGHLLREINCCHCDAADCTLMYLRFIHDSLRLHSRVGNLCPITGSLFSALFTDGCVSLYLLH